MRNRSIDILRGLGILAIIFIHVTAWYTSDRTAYFIWNWGQFAVPAFVFCSTYLFFVKKEKYESEGFINYSLIRLKRLLSPYYVYLIFFYLLYLFKDAAKINWQNILMNFTLTTPGNELNWAVLLFVYMTLLLLPLIYLWRKNRVVFWLYSLVSLTSSVLFLDYSWPYNYKLIMWLPWSLVILFSWYFARFESKKNFFPQTLVLTGMLFLFLYVLQNQLGNSLVFLNNKYPPNLYYLSYGMFSSVVIYYLAAKGVFNFIEKPLNYFSTNSYNIFFIHLFLIIALREFIDIQKFSWWVFFVLILALTLLIQLIFNRIRVLYGER